MTKTLHGVVHGSTIKLSDDPGLVEGQEVEVVLSPVVVTPTKPGDGLRRAAGALADDWTEEDDRTLQIIYEDRKRSTRELPQ